MSGTAPSADAALATLDAITALVAAARDAITGGQD